MAAALMHAQPGVFAVLLGSGASTGAGIPTGWGVVHDLIERIATADDPTDETSARQARENPDGWWTDHVGGELGYGTLLEALAPTAASRQGLLAKYFEPSDEDREAETKLPSKAHRAIAQLVKRGTVRVVLTTNFDRLMEQALEAVGISPQVVSRPDAIPGMKPLVHSKATVIKLHGDYQDLGSLNTPSELGAYPPPWQTLLEQVLDDYGLIISGWSAEWDTALVAALEGVPNRRYPLYWDSRSSKGDSAQRLLALRSGYRIEAGSADEMFATLLSSVEALDRLAEPPLSTALAIAKLKRYLPDPVHRIDLRDLVMGSAEAVANAIEDQPEDISGLNGEIAQKVYETHLESTAPLLHLMVSGLWLDPAGVHDQIWVDALQRLVDAAVAPMESIHHGLHRWRLIPALLVLYASGVALTQRRRDDFLIRLVTEVTGRRGFSNIEDPIPASQLLHPLEVLETNLFGQVPRWGGSRPYYPASRLLKADLRRFFDQFIPSNADYVDAAHGFEFRLGFIQEQQQDVAGANHAMPGEFVGERQWSFEQPPVLRSESAFRRAGEQRSDWPWVAYLGGQDEYEQALKSYRPVLERYRYGT